MLDWRVWVEWWRGGGCCLLVARLGGIRHEGYEGQERVGHLGPSG